MLCALPARLGAQGSQQQQQQQQQAGRWADPKCDLKPSHFLVNQGYGFLKSATTTKLEDQRKKDLADAQRVLTQAVTGDQDKNPAAWYYLARYYIMTDVPQGVDSAFCRAEALKPQCAADIGLWRRYLWVPAFNAGIAAWQANNTDSAIASFRRANALLTNEPTGFKYSAILFYNAGQSDSALLYFPARCGRCRDGSEIRAGSQGRALQSRTHPAERAETFRSPSDLQGISRHLSERSRDHGGVGQSLHADVEQRRRLQGQRLRDLPADRP